MNSIDQVKMCTQRILPDQQQEWHHIMTNSNSEHQTEKLAAAFYTQKLWPKNKTIRVAFMDTKDIPRTSIQSMQNLRGLNGQAIKIDPLQEEVQTMPLQQAVKKVVKERIQPLTSLKFEFVDTIAASDVRISFNHSGGAWSLVGTDCLSSEYANKATMNLGWFDVATTMHEFGHVLGMIHEHQNPRGQAIQWDVPKLTSYIEKTQGWSEQLVKTNILDRYSVDSLNGSNFDPLSIMLYFFPAEVTLNNKGTQQNLRLSGLDVVWINKMYPGEESPSQFYKSVYNESLDQAIANSGSSSGTFDWKKIGMILAIVVGILLIVGFIVWMIRKRSGNRSVGRSYRYGRW